MRSQRARTWRRGAWVTGIASLIACVAAGMAGYFDIDPVHVYPAKGQAYPIAVVNFSGDMGLRFLLGATTSRGLTANHIPVVGINTPSLFRRHHTRAQVDAIIADGIRVALARTGAPRLVVIGQSYGADVVETGLAHLPAGLREHVAAVILILPGDTVFYRADPTGLAYRGIPDSLGINSAASLDWTPLTCIHGMEETDSLCPLLRGRNVTDVAMPGDHEIRHDAAGLLRHVLEAIHRVAPMVPPGDIARSLES